MLLGYDYDNGDTYKHGDYKLLWRMDKGSITDKSYFLLVTCTSDLCWNQIVCERLAGSQRILLKHRISLLVLFGVTFMLICNIVLA